jgi:hypothetical protein
MKYQKKVIIYSKLINLNPSNWTPIIRQKQHHLLAKHVLNCLKYPRQPSKSKIVGCELLPVGSTSSFFSASPHKQADRSACNESRLRLLFPFHCCWWCFKAADKKGLKSATRAINTHFRRHVAAHPPHHQDQHHHHLFLMKQEKKTACLLTLKSITGAKGFELALFTPVAT